MAVVMESLFTQAQNGQVIDPALEEKIERQCARAELLIREALGIFERTELNLSWYRRLCEHREMIAGQMDAMAYFMEDAMEQDELCDEKERLHIAKIRFQLREVGLRVWELHFYRRKNGTCRIVMELAARPGICTTSKEVLAMIESCVSEPLVMAEENRNIVGRDRARYVFVTRPKIACTYGVSKMLQQKQTISGDSFGTKRLENGTFVMALSDGMGSGTRAHEESDTVVNLFLQFMEAGFLADMALRLMNAAMIFGADAERFSTLDACIIDEYTGIVDFYKVGAHVSFVRHKRRTEVIEASSLPMGASSSLDTLPSRSYLEPGDYLVLVTDGVLEYLQVEDAVEMLRELIQELTDTDAVTFARKIMERVLLFTGGTIADDMTVLVLKALER
jgi:stage II sporulation protein E